MKMKAFLFNKSVNMEMKAVLFDMDGTVIDSIGLHNRSLKEVVERLGVKVSERKLKSVLRLPTEEIYFRLDIKKKTGLNFQAFNHFKRSVYYEAVRKRNLVFPGLEAMLKRIRKSYKIGVVTNSSRVTVNESLPVHIQKLFGCIVTYDDVKRGKPYPEPVALALKKLGVEASETFFVGDSHFDVIACNELGIKCFAVLTGVSTRAELKRNGAWKILKRATDLEKFF